MPRSALPENLTGINVRKTKSDLGRRRRGIACEYCAKRDGGKARPLRTMRPCSILSVPRSALPEDLIGINVSKKKSNLGLSQWGIA